MKCVLSFWQVVNGQVSIETYSVQSALSYMPLLIRNLVQGLVSEVPYFWTSNGQIVVLKVP